MKLAWDELYILIPGDMMIDIRTGEVLGAKVDDYS